MTDKKVRVEKFATREGRNGKLIQLEPGSLEEVGAKINEMIDALGIGPVVKKAVAPKPAPKKATPKKKKK